METMRAFRTLTLALAYFVAAGLGVFAQAAKQPQSGAAGSPASNAPAQAGQPGNNAFPTDLSNVPVIPAHLSPGMIPGEDEESRGMAIPTADTDPVLSPEDAAADAQSGEQDWSSSQAGMRDLLPPTGDEMQPGRHKDKSGTEPLIPHETASDDEHVGEYYLDNGEWKAALSRYESALVLDPDNPDVYWGLAESERHLGQLAEARANYQKVIIYDSGTRMAKKALKFLKDPQIANAKPLAASSGGAQP